MENETRYMRVAQLSKYTGIATSTLWSMVKNKKIKSIKLSARVTVFDKIEIDKMMSNVNS